MNSPTLVPILGVVRVKEGVQFSMIAPGGFRILETISLVASIVGTNLEITSACDGCHSGLHDPHHRGEAYDIRTHGLTPEQLSAVLREFGEHLTPGRFYYFLEAAGTENEHIHVQVKKGTEYP